MNESFQQWRKQRPFWPGLCMILAGVEIMLSAYLSFSVSNIQVQISTLSGVSTLVVGVLLIVCGAMTLWMPEGRILAGVAAMVLAVVALPTSNFGGFLLGTLVALLAGAAALAWVPRRECVRA